MGNALFVVWRESLEALLIVGILYAWLKQNDPVGGLRALWIGVAAGLGAALALAWTMVAVQDALSGQVLEWFQIGIVLLAAALITQMVLWMQKHGRNMKRSLESEIAHASEKSGHVGIIVITMLAIAREGAETVVFLYGIGQEGDFRSLLLGGGLGLLLAFATSWLLARGLRFFNYRNFFRITGALLFIFASALLVTGVERLIGMGMIPALIEPLWDTSALLDDFTTSGKLIGALTGYRSQPALTLVMAYVAYWALMIVLQRKRD
jgi:high-affinity iron transporter